MPNNLNTSRIISLFLLIVLANSCTEDPIEIPEPDTTPPQSMVLYPVDGESVAGNDEHGIDPTILDGMAASVRSCKDIGAEIGIVIGGGNLFRGKKLKRKNI